MKKLDKKDILVKIKTVVNRHIKETKINMEQFH